MTINTTNRTLGFVFIFLAVFLFGYAGQAQTLGSLYTQEGDRQFYIEEGESLKSVLEEVEEHYNVGLLYRSNIVEGLTVRQATYLSLNVEEALSFLLKGTDLRFKELNPKTYGIYKNAKTIPSVLEAVQQNVSGRIVDAEIGEALPGVNIVLKGTSTGTSTDSNGEYTLRVESLQDTLVLSFMGFQTQEVPINGRTEINIEMYRQTISGEELVVVGYSSVKKANLTAAVSEVDTKTLSSINSNNLIDGLQGKAPGLNVKLRSSEPGEYSSSFNIRGYGDPIVVIDGIVRDDIGKLQPNSIESISILKGPAAAVYGVKAANGVILVQTKKGRKMEKPSIEYSSNYELNTLTDANTTDMNNAYQYATQLVETAVYHGNEPPYSREDLEKFKDGTYPSTDWEDAAFKNFNWGMRHNLSVSGGSERITYYTSVGYSKNVGLLRSGDLNYQKYNVQSNITGDITDNLTAELRIDGILGVKNQPAYDRFGAGPPNNINPNGGSVPGESSAAWHYTRMNKPTIPLYANDTPPYYGDPGYPYHPIPITHSDIGGYANRNERNFQGNLTLNYNFEVIEGLSAKAMYGYLNRNTFAKEFVNTYEVYRYDQETETYNVSGVQNDPAALAGEYYSYEQNTLIGQVAYDQVFSKNHDVAINLSYEGRMRETDDMWSYKEFAIPVDQFYAGESENTVASSRNIYSSANQNLVGTLNYNYASKYLLQTGFNYSGSSNFPEGKRWGFFPFVSIGWSLSEEKFIKDNLPFISNLKVRGSWGESGDDSAAAYQFLSGYTYPSGNYVFDDKVTSGLGFKGMINPNITWFTATSKNIGIDISLFEDLISMNLDLFQRDRSGLLATRVLSIPTSVGATLPEENLNSDMRKGFEVIIGHSLQLGELNYDISASLSYSRSQMKHVERAPSGNSYLNWRNNTENRWNNLRWGYKYIGQFQSQEDINNSPIQDGQGNRTFSPGDLKYEDVNKDGLVNEMDQVPINRLQQPEYNYSLNIDLAWKNFDMNIFFQGAANYNFQYKGYNFFVNRWGRNSINAMMDRWHHEDIFDPDSPLVPGRYPQTGAINTVPSNHWMSSFWIPNASYLRFKELNIGYTIRDSFLTQKLGVQNINIYVKGTNLITWTNMELVDPESDDTIGWSGNNAYPVTTNYYFGLNFKF